jgi:hypothetical protein
MIPTRQLFWVNGMGRLEHQAEIHKSELESSEAGEGGGRAP